MIMADAFGHLPFLSNGTLASGSFFGASTEDRFMNFIWRLRRWRLRFSGALQWIYPAGATTITAFPASESYIYCGENNQNATGAFSGPDDILCDWRQTGKFGRLTWGNLPGESAMDIWWGDTGQYSEVSASGGTLTSGILIEMNPFGDGSIFLGTDSTDIRLDGGASGISIIFDPDAGGTAVPLFKSDDESDYPGAYWSAAGNIYLEQGALYWPWNIAGTPTWNTTTGEQLRSPTRLDTNNSPLTYCCTFGSP